MLGLVGIFGALAAGAVLDSLMAIGLRPQKEEEDDPHRDEEVDDRGDGADEDGADRSSLLDWASSDGSEDEGGGTEPDAVSDWLADAGADPQHDMAGDSDLAVAHGDLARPDPAPADPAPAATGVGDGDPAWQETASGDTSDAGHSAEISALAGAAQSVPPDPVDEGGGPATGAAAAGEGAALGNVPPEDMRPEDTGGEDARSDDAPPDDVAPDGAPLADTARDDAAPPDPSDTPPETDAAGQPLSDDLPRLPDPGRDLSGTSGDDILTGGDGDDTIAGDAGGDLIAGGAGDDGLDGGPGDDELHGGAGNDLMAGGDGDDTLHGEDGGDMLTGGAGDDSLAGHCGDDSLSGDAGQDTLSGGAGQDSLDGGDGGDTLQGGEGDDRVAGGSGADEVDGGDGNDTLFGADEGHRDGGIDFLNGGTGDDRLTLNGGDWGNGGEGHDIFALDLAPGDPPAHIADFDRGTDELTVIYDPSLHPDPHLSMDETPAGDSTLLLDGVPLAVLHGGAGLDLASISLIAGPPAPSAG